MSSHMSVPHVKRIFGIVFVFLFCVVRLGSGREQTEWKRHYFKRKPRHKVLQSGERGHSVPESTDRDSVNTLRPRRNTSPWREAPVLAVALHLSHVGVEYDKCYLDAPLLRRPRRKTPPIITELASCK